MHLITLLCTILFYLSLQGTSLYANLLNSKGWAIECEQGTCRIQATGKETVFLVNGWIKQPTVENRSKSLENTLSLTLKSQAQQDTEWIYQKLILSDLEKGHDPFMTTDELAKLLLKPLEQEVSEICDKDENCSASTCEYKDAISDEGEQILVLAYLCVAGDPEGVANEMTKHRLEVTGAKEK